MERFQRLYELPKNLYVNDTPIMISAGALTKDKNTGKIFIQLKIKNISEKVIKAVFVKIILVYGLFYMKFTELMF